MLLVLRRRRNLFAEKQASEGFHTPAEVTCYKERVTPDGVKQAIRINYSTNRLRRRRRKADIAYQPCIYQHPELTLFNMKKEESGARIKLQLFFVNNDFSCLNQPLRGFCTWYFNSALGAYVVEDCRSLMNRVYQLKQFCGSFFVLALISSRAKLSVHNPVIRFCMALQTPQAKALAKVIHDKPC